MTAYFTEREGNLPPQTEETVTPEFSEAVRGWLNGLCERGWLARGRTLSQTVRLLLESVLNAPEHRQVAQP